MIHLCRGWLGSPFRAIVSHHERLVLISQVEELNGVDQRIRVTLAGSILEVEENSIDKGREE